MKYAITDDWLKKRYLDDLADVRDMAAEIGCSVATIKKKVEGLGLKRGKIRQKLKLVKAWNEGLTKETNEKLKRLSISRTGVGNPMSGRKAWNGGLTKSDDARVASISEKLTGRTVSQEAKERMRNAKLGKVRELANNWRGGLQYRNGYGVHRRTVCGRRMYAHRLVAEKSLGRPLKRSEHVHHIDRNKANNTPENLLVMSNGTHTRLHAELIKGDAVGKSEQIAWLLQNGCEFEECK